jgi:quercetin dioxygenase-like cupin family protein
MVVQIEGARTNPSVSVLGRLADAFGVTVAALVEVTSPRHIVRTAIGDVPVLWQGGYGGIARLVRDVPTASPLEIWEWRLEPHDRHDWLGVAGGIHHVLYLLSGEVTVELDGHSHVLRPGDIIDFVAGRAHAVHNTGTSEAWLLGALARDRPPLPVSGADDPGSC